MPRKQKPKNSPGATVPPEIRAATLGSNGSVRKGVLLSESQAVLRRRTGDDVVVCGPTLAENRRLAGQIERTANGTVKRCPPHASAGPYALPHYQPDPRPPPGTPSMKPSTAKPLPDAGMQFFTPDLYVRFNSADDAVADAADAEWEAAADRYRTHIASLRRTAPPDVRKLADLAPHDAEVQGYDRVTETVRLLGVVPVRAERVYITLERAGDRTSLIYLLGGGVLEHRAPKAWPFSKVRPHWLYDELAADPATPHLYRHRVLFSDGRVLDIPFASVVVHTAPVLTRGRPRPARRSA